MSPRSKRLIAALACSWSIAAMAQSANTALDDVHRLHYSGQTAAALDKADAYLKAKPDDARMRFLKGVVLADADRRADAIAVFEKLVDDHPDLAEPYNNLAALYAAGGDYGRARLTLEQALRTNPNFATAHENLGDIYAALAGQAYARAQQLEPASTSLGPKLALVRELFRPVTAASAGASAPVR